MVAYLRAVWIAPALFPALLPDVEAPLHAEYDRLLRTLRAIAPNNGIQAPAAGRLETFTG